MADTQTTSGDLNELLRQSPFGPLLDIQGANGNKLTVQDIFGGVGAPGGGNAFSGNVNIDANSPYGGNPFAGDNFWNTFAGGVNPSNTTGNSAPVGLPTGSNSAPATLPTGSSTPVNPLAGDGSEFWNTFAGGVNPTTFSSSSIPVFAGGNSPQGFPTGDSSTPVPEPSSVLGIAVIGLGVAATKFRQHQRRAVKVFNK